MKTRLAIAAVALLLAGCASLAPKLEAPDLEVVDVRLLRGDFAQQQLRVRMKVTNPNDRELPVKGITYAMEVGGEQFATGESERAFVVPALGAAEFDMSMNADMAGALLRLMSGGRKLDAIDYRLSGKVSLSSGLLRSVPFEKKGTFSLR